MQAVLPASQGGKRPVLAHGEHQHVAATPPVKIT